MKIIGLLNQVAQNVLIDPTVVDSYVFADVAIENFDSGTMKAFDYTDYVDALPFASRCHKTDYSTYLEDGTKKYGEIPKDIFDKAVKIQKIILESKLDRYADLSYENAVRASGIEVSTWTKQESEARAYVADNSTSTPLIDALALERGINKDELVSKIIIKADAYIELAAEIVGNIQSIKDKISTATTIVELKTITLPEGVSLHIFTKID